MLCILVHAAKLDTTMEVDQSGSDKGCESDRASAGATSKKGAAALHCTAHGIMIFHLYMCVGAKQFTSTPKRKCMCVII